MNQALEKYLDKVMVYANRNENDSARIRAELEDHLLKKIDDLRAEGLSDEEAALRAIEKHGDMRTVGYGLRKRFPLLDVRTYGTARGFVAIGPKAVGIIAIGGIACGVFSYGGVSLGFLSLGLLSLGMVASVGGFSLALGGFAFGVIALGLMAFGLLSFGITAMGGLPISVVRDPFYVSHGVKVISWFTSENAPDYLLYTKNLVESMADLVFIPFWISCIVLLTVYLILFGRERSRLKGLVQD
jgi:hypothetical protein